ncbi:MAG: signal peptidase I [Lachnospiraceae bacterium]|nr:signal peptidase I [Lachnospiraceae bacterium]
MEKKEKTVKTLTTEEIERELKRVRYNERYGKTLRSTVYTLITVAAVAVLVATLLLPVLRIYGSSMTPTLVDGDLIVSVKEAKFERGDIIAFYYNNKILVKRVIANPGEWIDIDPDGDVAVNGILIEEPYIQDKSLGECNLEFPYQVPEGKIFVMGDHRSVSVDSRHTSVGCVAEEQIVGRLVMRIWPLSAIGMLE